jgi:hypothetical protein
MLLFECDPCFAGKSRTAINLEGGRSCVLMPSQLSGGMRDKNCCASVSMVGRR